MFQWIKNTYRHGNYLKLETLVIDRQQMTISSNPSLNLEYVHDPLIKDNFQLHVYSDYTLRIRYGSNRSRRYAFYALESLQLPLAVGIYEGGPDFQIRGIIEGFYGTPWSHEDRKDVISFIEKYQMNSYFYAPKDDLYHRELWRDPYPKLAFSKIQELIQLSHDHDVDFYFCISPGKDFVYTEDSEFNILFQKIDQIINMGVYTFALLMDDIDYKLEGQALKRFERPGVAHAYISNRLNAFLKEKIKNPTLVMCPTEYAQNVDSVYRKDLALQMDDDIMVFWTGYNTVAEFIPDLDGQRAIEFFKHPLILWDNYPVNDMAKDRLFMGPIRNRGKKLDHTHTGMVSNPMVEWHLSKPTVITMAMYMWDVSNYEPDQAYDQAILSLTQNHPKIAQSLKSFMDENYDSLIYERQCDIIESINCLDFDRIQQYFDQLVSAIDDLENHPFDAHFVNQAKPWFHRIRNDAKCFKEMRNNQVSRERLVQLFEDKHTPGRQILLHLSIKMGLIDADQIPKKRMVFWELKANQL